ncbi:MAG: hypothetical protein IT288_01420 [Bdellovibrionales bacterium]|nr:hypothetical protein [Bdellovibrionales bacterium]
MIYQPYSAAEIDSSCSRLGLSLRVSPEQWNQAGKTLSERQQWGEEFARRVHEFYLPIFFWCLREKSKIPSSRSFFVGISGAQGCGKSTLALILRDCFALFGCPTTAISIDDFYRTRKELDELARANSENPYLQMRGYPGTHDVALGLDVLTRLKLIHPGDEVQIPRFDKSAFSGKGDRRPTTERTPVPSSNQVVIVEGWMLGFRALPSLQIADENLRQINSFLPDYETWYRQLDSFIHLDPKEIEFVLQWRVEAEQNMRHSGLSGMSDEEVKKYVQAFLPAYRTYLPGLRELDLTRGSQIRMVINRDRLPLSKNEFLALPR